MADLVQCSLTSGWPFSDWLGCVIKSGAKCYGIRNNSFLVGMPPCPVDIHTHSLLYYTMTTSDIMVANMANETTLECALL